MRYLDPARLTARPVLVETVDGTVHVAAIIELAGVQLGPIRSAEGCNLDDAGDEVVRELDTKSAIVDVALCGNCGRSIPTEVLT